MLKLRDQKLFQKKLQEEMARQGFDALILTSPDAIYYSTGYASSFLYTTYQTGYCMSLVPASGECEVIMMEMERQTAEAQLKDVVIHTYPTWIYIDDEGMDTGAILEKAETPIGAEETSGELFDRLSVLGAELLVSTLEKWERGDLTPLPQDESLATHAPILKKEMARLDFSHSAQSLCCSVRGFSPWPVAYTTLEGKRLKIYSAAVGGATSAPAGALLQQGETLAVACGDGRTLELRELQLEGGRRMTAAEWLKGRPVVPGTTLGNQ